MNIFFFSLEENKNQHLTTNVITYGECISRMYLRTYLFTFSAHKGVFYLQLLKSVCCCFGFTSLEVINIH